jgi:hypothetical protein
MVREKDGLPTPTGLKGIFDVLLDSQPINHFNHSTQKVGLLFHPTVASGTQYD